MESIDRNDVDISVLFSWGDEFILVTPRKEEIPVFVRLVGDADLNRARVYALRESAQLRRKLKQEGSDERLAYIPEIDEKDSLVDGILSLRIRDYRTEVMKDIDLKWPKEPQSDATLEEQEEHQKKVDTWPEERLEVIRKGLEEIIDRERKQLSKMKEDKLRETFEKAMIDSLCEAHMYRKFNDMCAYYGTFIDPEYKIRLAKDFEEFDNFHSDVKKQLINFYESLDVPVGQLKK